MKFLNLILLLCICQLASAQTNKPKAHLNHTAIFVKNIAISDNFYSDIIGLDTVPEPVHDGKHYWYKTAEHATLHVIEGSEANKEYYKNQHTCFTVSNFNAFIENLKQRHWAFEDYTGNPNKVTTRIDGVHQIYLQDPDGYWIEINDDNY